MERNTKFLAAAAQMGPIQPGETKESAVLRMIDLLKAAAVENVSLVVYPELCFTTFFPRYFLKNESGLAPYFENDLPTEIISELLNLAKANEIFVCFGYAEKAGQNYFNTAAIFSDTGEFIGKYRKIHLPGHSEYEAWRAFQHLEKRYFKKGNLGFPVFSSKLGELGMCICNDRRWPETFRMLALKGCEIAMLGYNTPRHYPLAPEHDHLQDFHNHLCMQGASYANGLWIIASAKAGIEDGCELIGGSCIISPTGEIKAQAATLDDELVISEIDLAECDRIRSNIFNFKLHRQPDDYKALAES